MACERESSPDPPHTTVALPAPPLVGELLPLGVPCYGVPLLRRLISYTSMNESN